jgi:hypothetical protein
MKCYYHRDRDAIGECKSCGKGLCPECAVDLGKGLACRDRCERDAKALIAFIEHNMEMTRKASALLGANRQAHLWSGALFIALGAVFGAWGLVMEPRHDFVVLIGAVFLAYGLFSLTRALRMPRANTVHVAEQEDKSSV